MGVLLHSHIELIWVKLSFCIFLEVGVGCWVKGALGSILKRQ